MPLTFQIILSTGVIAAALIMYLVYESRAIDRANAVDAEAARMAGTVEAEKGTAPRS